MCQAITHIAGAEWWPIYKVFDNIKINVMKQTGTSSLILFNVQSDFDKELNANSRERIVNSGRYNFKDMGLKFQAENVPLIPKESDFAFFPFRHISATIVGSGTFKSTDFSVPGVLRASTSLLENVTAYTNHIEWVGEDVGYVGTPEYTEEYTNSQGKRIPGGIDAPFVIDSVLHPVLVRKLSSPVSTIHSASVGVMFKWEASHDFEDPSDFFWHLGEIVNDEEVRRVAQEIMLYNESSFVFKGADPFAKKLNENGEVVNINAAEVFSKQRPGNFLEYSGHNPKRKYFVVSCLDKQKYLHLEQLYSKKQDSTKQKDVMNKELVKHFSTVFNVSEEDILSGKFSVEDAKKFNVTPAGEGKNRVSLAKYNAVKKTNEELTEANEKLQNDFDTLETEKETLEAERDTLKQDAEEAKKFTEFGKSKFTETKEEAKRLYTSFSGGSPDELIVKEIEEETDFSKLESKIKMWGGQLATKFSATCKDCGKNNIVFRSSTEPGGESIDDDKKGEVKHLAQML